VPEWPPCPIIKNKKNINPGVISAGTPVEKEIIPEKSNNKSIDAPISYLK
jgi:hypothetical protein